MCWCNPSKGTRMTDEEIHNIYLHMSGKAEGLVEATGNADFPVLFARAILEYGGLTKDAQNMASKSTYKEQLEAKDEPVAWEQFHEHMAGPNYVAPKRTWIGLTDEDMNNALDYWSDNSRSAYGGAHAANGEYVDMIETWRYIEAKLKEKNT